MTAALLVCLSLAGPPRFVPDPGPPVSEVVTAESDPVAVPGRPGHFDLWARPLGRSGVDRVRLGPATTVRLLRGRFGRVGSLRSGMVLTLWRRRDRVTEVLVVGTTD